MNTTAALSVRPAACAESGPCVARARAGGALPGLLVAAALLVAGPARAQTSACDQLKAVLAARIEATGVRGYALEAVPADAPVPPGAKAIGNCEAGAYKVLYSRWGGAPSSPSAASAAASSAALLSVAPPARHADALPVTRASSVPAAPPPASAPVATTRRAEPHAAPAAPPATTAATPLPVPAQASAPVVVAATTREPAIKPPPQVDMTASAKAWLARHPFAFKPQGWRWALALLLLPLLLALWAWRAYRSAYDEAGLPRGPKL